MVGSTLLQQKLRSAIHVMGPTLTALLFAGIGSGVAHAQGTMDFSGAQTLMSTFNPRFSYVSVSSASHDAQIYTNNAATLTKSLSRDVSKASAIESRKGQTSAPPIGFNQAATISKGPGLGRETSL
jgi:hypothetical protein